MTAAVTGIISGLGVHGYPLAVEHIAYQLKNSVVT
jgi:3-dehydroquinate dehydratase